MRVVCDQCASTYKVPNEKLSKPINKATCRQCGSRLLIPKPQLGADPDERVVVPAIPPTQGVGDGGFVEAKVEDDADKTMPVVRRGKKKPEDDQDDVALITGTPISHDDRAVIARARGGNAPEPVRVAVVQQPAPVYAPAPVPAPAPPPVYAQPAIAAPVAPRASAAPGAGVGLALVCSFAAAVGILIAALGTHPIAAVGGTALGLAGAFTAIMALAFVQSGAADGKPVVSAPAGMVLGVVLAGVVGLARGLDVDVDGGHDRGGPDGTPVAAAGQAAPAPQPVAVASADPSASTTARSEGSDVRRPAAVPTEPVRAQATQPTSSVRSSATQTPAARSEPVRAVEPEVERPRVQPAPEPAPVAKPEPAPVAKAEPQPAPKAAPQPAPKAVSEPATGSSRPAGSSSGVMASVAPEVIHTIVSSNVAVKRCFFDAIRTNEIAPPITVNTQFNLSATGSASNLRVSNSDLSGGRLERCLDGAVRSMSFPPSAKGGPVNYPFKL